MRTAFLCLALLGYVLATPQGGYYQQEYNYKSSSKAFTNNELQRSTDDQGYFRKHGDLEGREKPIVDANSEHSEYVNPKLRAGQYSSGYAANSDLSSQGIMNAQHGYGSAYDVNDLMAAENAASSDHIAGSRAYKGLQSGSSSYGAKSNYGSSSSYGSSGAYGSSSNYGSGYNDRDYRTGSYGSDYASSNIQSVVHSLQQELEQDVQQQIRDHNAHSQTRLDIGDLEQRIRDKMNERLRNELDARYGKQTIKQGMSYTISNGHVQNTANYDEQEYQKLRRELENTLLSQLRSGYRRYDTHYEGSQSSNFGYTATSTTTYRPIYPSLPYSTTPRPVVYVSAPNPERLTKILSDVQSDLDTKLNEMLNNVYQRYFSSSQSYQLTNTDVVLRDLEDQLRSNISYILNDELRRNYGSQMQRDGMMYSIGTNGQALSNHNYAVRDLENLKAQVERNLLTKLQQSFNSYKTRWTQSHSSSSSSSGSNVIYGNGYGTYGYSSTPRYEYTTPARYAYSTPNYYYSTPSIGGSLHQAGIKNYQYSGGSNQAGYISSGSSSSSTNTEQLQRQLQSELSSQLQDAVARDNYGHDAPQALQHLTDELNRNITRRVQEFSGSASYSASGHFDQAQMQALQNQLQSQLSRELQQKMQEHFQSSSSYSMSGGSSSHYRPVRGSQTYQQLAQYRTGGATYTTGEDCDHDDNSYRNYRNKRSYGTYHRHNFQTSHSNAEELDLGQEPEQLGQEIDDTDLTQQIEDNEFENLQNVQKIENPQIYDEGIDQNGPSIHRDYLGLQNVKPRPYPQVGSSNSYGSSITTQQNDVNIKQELKTQVKQEISLELEQIVQKYQELKKVSSTVSQIYYQESTKEVEQKIKEKLEEIYGIKNGRSHTTISAKDQAYLNGLKQEIYQEFLKTLQQKLNIDGYQRWQSSSSHSYSISQPHHQQKYNDLVSQVPINTSPLNVGNQQTLVSETWDSSSLNGRQRRFFEYTKNKLKLDLKENLKNQNVLVYDKINNHLQANVTNAFKSYSEYFLKDYLEFNDLQITNIQKQLLTDLKEELHTELDNNYPSVQRPNEQIHLVGQIPEDDLTQQVENVDNLPYQNNQDQRPAQRPLPQINAPYYQTYNQLVRRPQPDQSYTNQQQDLHQHSFGTNANTQGTEEFKPMYNPQNRPNDQFAGQVIEDDDTQNIENPPSLEASTNKPIFSQNQLNNQFVGQVIDEDDDIQKLDSELDVKPNTNKPIYSQNQVNNAFVGRITDDYHNIQKPDINKPIYPQNQRDNQFVGQVIDEDDENTQKLENEFNVKPNTNQQIYSENQRDNQFVGQVIDEDGENTQKLENELNVKPNTNQPLYSQNQRDNQFVGQVIDEDDENTQKLENEFTVKPSTNQLIYSQNQRDKQFVGQVIDEDEENTQKLENEFNVKPNTNQPIYSQNQRDNQFVGQVIDEDDENTQKLENEFNVKPNANKPIYSQNQINNAFVGPVTDEGNIQQTENEFHRNPNTDQQIQSQNHLSNEFQEETIDDNTQKVNNELFTWPNQNQQIQSQNKPNNEFVGQTVDEGDEYYSQPNPQLVHSDHQHNPEFVEHTIDDHKIQKTETNDVANGPYLNQPNFPQHRPNNEFVGQTVDEDGFNQQVPQVEIAQTRPQTNDQYQPKPNSTFLLQQPLSIYTKPLEGNVGQTIDNDETQQIENEYYPNSQNNKPTQSSLSTSEFETTVRPINQNLYGYRGKPISPQSSSHHIDQLATSQNIKPNEGNVGQTIENDETPQTEHEYYTNPQNIVPAQNPLSTHSQTSINQINQHLYGYGGHQVIPQSSYSRNPSTNSQFENRPQGTQYQPGNQYNGQSFPAQSQNIDSQQVEDSFLSQSELPSRKPNTLTDSSSFLQSEFNQQQQVNNLPTLKQVEQEQNGRTTESPSNGYAQVPEIQPPSYIGIQYPETESRQRAEAKADALLEFLRRSQKNQHQSIDRQNPQTNSYPSLDRQNTQSNSYQSLNYGTYNRGSSRLNSYNYRQVVEESPHSTYGSNLNEPASKPNTAHNIPSRELNYGEQHTLHHNVETVSDIEPLERGHASPVQNVDQPNNYGVKGHGRRLILTQRVATLQQATSVLPPSDEPGVTESKIEETTVAVDENLPWWKRFGNKVKQGAQSIKEKVVG